jgi:hypothetical protein
MSTSSPAQVLANRENALHSTGPKSAEGKAASSSNALRTGLTSAKIFVRPEEQPEFDSFRLALTGELKPEGQMQSNYFDLILHAAWNIRRSINLEAEIQNEAIAKNLADALLDDDLSLKLGRLYRYKKMHESSHNKAVTELRRLQTNERLARRLNAAPEEKDEKDESVLAVPPRPLNRKQPSFEAMAANRFHQNMAKVFNSLDNLAARRETATAAASSDTDVNKSNPIEDPLP